MPEFIVEFEDELDPTDTITMEVVGYMPIFGSVEGADRYFSECLYGHTWEILSLDTKQKALMTATRSIDNLRFTGSKTASDQPLQWPRNGDTEVPDAVRRATYEEALALANGADPNTEYDSIFVSSRVFGKVRTDYDRRTAPAWTLAGIVSQKTWILLRPFLNPTRTLRLRRES